MKWFFPSNWCLLLYMCQDPTFVSWQILDPCVEFDFLRSILFQQCVWQDKSAAYIQHNYVYYIKFCQSYLTGRILVAMYDFEESAKYRYYGKLCSLTEIRTAKIFPMILILLIELI
ncbi:hypothetical protein GOP47_0022195 [Adiantum capillus-veneris]|uniref:Secreted protein n=1 Tax=Adiantum capillus-veneris TaxID=13818 RepID=A0A9D4U9U5_ADICA|nr:hypothetical protein GOP47_0022195 [Adiantum capillus-veneris]